MACTEYEVSIHRVVRKACRALSLPDDVAELVASLENVNEEGQIFAHPNEDFSPFSYFRGVGRLSARLPSYRMGIHGRHVFACCPLSLSCCLVHEWTTGKKPLNSME